MGDVTDPIPIAPTPAALTWISDPLNFSSLSAWEVEQLQTANANAYGDKPDEYYQYSTWLVYHVGDPGPAITAGHGLLSVRTNWVYGGGPVPDPHVDPDLPPNVPYITISVFSRLDEKVELMRGWSGVVSWDQWPNWQQFSLPWNPGHDSVMPHSDLFFQVLSTRPTRPGVRFILDSYDPSTPVTILPPKKPAPAPPTRPPGTTPQPPYPNPRGPDPAVGYNPPFDPGATSPPVTDSGSGMLIDIVREFSGRVKWPVRLTGPSTIEMVESVGLPTGWDETDPLSAYHATTRSAQAGQDVLSIDRGNLAVNADAQLKADDVRLLASGWRSPDPLPVLGLGSAPVKRYSFTFTPHRFTGSVEFHFRPTPLIVRS